MVEGTIGRYARQGLFKCLASTRDREFSIYEAEDSHRAMMAIRQLCGKQYPGFVYKNMVDDPGDPLALGAYWDWICLEAPRKIFLFHRNMPIAHSYLMFLNDCSGICWDFLNYNEVFHDPGVDIERLKESMHHFDDVLRKRHVINNAEGRSSVFYFIDRSLPKYAGSTNELDRISVASQMNIRHNNFAGLARRLACDESWKVRWSLASNPTIHGETLEILSNDPDWRVRRGICMNRWLYHHDIRTMNPEQKKAIWNLMYDECFEVRVAATLVSIGSYSGNEEQDEVARRIFDMKDEQLKLSALMRIM